MTVLEQQSASVPHNEFVPRVMTGRAADLDLPDELPDLVGYVELAVAGGYPPVIGASEAARRSWLDSYVEQLVLRDVPELGEIRDPRRCVGCFTP